FFQAEDGIRDRNVTGVQTCALPILRLSRRPTSRRTPIATAAATQTTTEAAEPNDAPPPNDRRPDDRPPGLGHPPLDLPRDRRARSEERRVGKEGRCRWARDHEKKER